MPSQDAHEYSCDELVRILTVCCLASEPRPDTDLEYAGQDHGDTIPKLVENPQPAVEAAVHTAVILLSNDNVTAEVVEGQCTVMTYWLMYCWPGACD